MSDKFMKPNVDLTKNASKEGIEYSYTSGGGYDYCDLGEEKKEENE